jgi:ubiquitin carboxyl-terminal hydrolase 7
VRFWQGTAVEGTIQQLFEGHHMNYIECINVDYKSTRKESFYDLQLDVKGCKDVYESFDKYVEVERLEGDNKYQAEQLGLQDAKKGVLFIDFPPVLQLQLKRFEYDFMRDTMVKINDRYEFPLQLDLDREDGKYLSPDADRSVRNHYTLHSVLVHSGGVHGGHYYAFIRPTLSDQW